MADWNPTEYLIFEKERSRPAADLVKRINHSNPGSIMDVGCGPGNSTNILYDRWKQASITGIDNSPAMLEKAKMINNSMTWVLCDVSGDLSHLGKFDIIFSNAVFQWIPQNEVLIAKLFKMLNQNGVLAAQIPYVKEMPIHKIIMDIASRPKWSEHFRHLSTSYKLYSPEFYYDVLCGMTQDIDLWETRYFHIMNGYDDILQWFTSTGLRPYLDCLSDDMKKTEFTNDILTEIRQVYTTFKDGKILFPFHRIFFTAYK
ncbi:MAG: trans-aconitate methyltransferase [Firmicutes bacterium HGW-Firmicutes-15]|nr:MAG: trans-aconitate methyltransferase [Firmicutes bacterium HGW-Firmicutes-15]